MRKPQLPTVVGLAAALVAGLAFAAPPQSIPQPETVRPFQPPLPPSLASLDAYVENVRDTFDVPGIAVAVV